MNYYEELVAIKDSDDDYRNYQGNAYIVVDNLLGFKQTKFYDDLRHNNISKETLLKLFDEVYFSYSILSLIIEKISYNFNTKEILKFLNNTNGFESNKRVELVLTKCDIPTVEEFVGVIDSIESFIDITNLLYYYKNNNILPYFPRSGEVPYILCEAIIHYGMRHIDKLTCRYKNFNSSMFSGVKRPLKEISDFVASCEYFNIIFNIDYFIDFLNSSFYNNKDKIAILIDITLFSLKFDNDNPLLNLKNIAKIIKQCEEWNDGQKIIKSINLGNGRIIDRFFDMMGSFVQNADENFNFIVEHLVFDLIPYFHRDYTINHIFSIIIKYYNDDAEKINIYFDSLLQSAVSLKGLNGKELLNNETYPTHKMATFANKNTRYMENYLFSKDMLQSFVYMTGFFETTLEKDRNLDVSVLRAMTKLNPREDMVDFIFLNHKCLRKIFGFYYGLHSEVIDVYDMIFDEETFNQHYDQLDIEYIIRSKHLNFKNIKSIVEQGYYSADHLFSLLIKNNRAPIQNFTLSELIQFYLLVEDMNVKNSIFSFLGNDQERTLVGKGILQTTSKEEFLTTYYKIIKGANQ